MSDNLPTLALFNSVESFCLKSGLFDRVNTFAADEPPGNGVYAAIWADRLRPVDGSGLSFTSASVDFNIRIYSSVLTLPPDIIDPNIIQATSTLFGLLIDDLDLEGLARQIDIRGIYGVAMDARAGYMSHKDGSISRVMTIVLPIIVNDVWEEG